MSLEAAAARAVGEPVTLGRAVGGGDISEASRGRTASGRDVFVKSGAGLPDGVLLAEAAGLRALASTPGGCRVPEVLGVEADALVLEWIERGRPVRAYWEALGRGLAAQHRVRREACGWGPGDNFIGRTTQPNPDETRWVVFFRDHRLGHQQALLRAAGRGSGALDRALDRLRDRLGEWLGDVQPSLLHGDLWGGNAMAGPGGVPVIYDPAAYFGDREADLAMTELFGGFDAAFYAAYREAWPVEPGYAERRDLYNLYHVLNHANLFGGGYSGQAERIARRYVG